MTDGSGLTFRDAYGRALVKAKLSDNGQAEYERRIAEAWRQPDRPLPEADDVAFGASGQAPVRRRPSRLAGGV
ncbi:hypothetical protein [Xanthobacter sediminis]